MSFGTTLDIFSRDKLQMIGIEGKHPCNYATNTQDYSKNFKDEPSFITIVTDFSKRKKIEEKKFKNEKNLWMEIKP